MKKNHFFISLLFLFVVLPFFSFVNLYPFTRYAMFAEPVSNSTTEEVFILCDQDHNPIDLKKRDFPLPISFVNYQARKAYYKGQTRELIQTLRKAINTENIKQLVLIRKTGNKLEIVEELPL